MCLCLCVCVHVCTFISVWAHMFHNMHVVIRGQLSEGGFSFTMWSLGIKFRLGGKCF